MMMMTMNLLFTALLASQLTIGVVAENLSYNMGEFSVDVNGNQNVPKYVFESEALSNSTYKIMFQKIYETDDSGNQLYKKSLPSLNWEFVQDEDDQSVFWINCLGAKGNGGSVPWDSLKFKNTLFNATVKFDVMLDGYDWSDDAATALNLAWKFTTSGEDEEEAEEELDETDGGLEPVEETATEVCFGDGLFCFDIVSTADVLDPTSGNVTGTTDATLSFDGQEGVTVTYDRFDGNLLHDPEFGIIGESSDDCGGILGGLFCLLGSIFFCF